MRSVDEHIDPFARSVALAYIRATPSEPVPDHEEKVTVDGYSHHTQTAGQAGHLNARAPASGATVTEIAKTGQRQLEQNADERHDSDRQHCFNRERPKEITNKPQTPATGERKRKIHRRCDRLCSIKR